jgi:hypothetical protein
MVAAVNGPGGVIGMRLTTGRPFRPRLALKDDFLVASMPRQGAALLHVKNTRVAAQLDTNDPQPGDTDDSARPVLSKDCARLFLVGKRQLTIWHIKTGHVFETAYPVKEVRDATVSQDGRTLALLLDKGQIVMFAVEDKKIEAKVEEKREELPKVHDVGKGLRFAGEITDKAPSVVYPVKLTAGKTYVIDMIAAKQVRLDPFLRLHDSAGKQLAEDDDSGGGLNARIVFRASVTDTYQITATRLTGTGPFSLEVKEQQ